MHKVVVGTAAISVLAGVAFLGATLSTPKPVGDISTTNLFESQTVESPSARDSEAQAFETLANSVSTTRLDGVSEYDLVDSLVPGNETVLSVRSKESESDTITSDNAPGEEGLDDNPPDLQNSLVSNQFFGVKNMSTQFQGCVNSSMAMGCKMQNQIPFLNIMFRQWSGMFGMTCPVVSLN